MKKKKGFAEAYIEKHGGQKYQELVNDTMVTMEVGTLRMHYEFEFPEYWRLGRIKDNPYYAVEAYNLLRKYNKPLPEWVLEYLDKLANGRAGPPTNRDVNNAKTLERKIAIAMEAHDIKEKTGREWIDIEGDLSEKHSKSEDEIRKYRSTLKRFLDYYGDA